MENSSGGGRESISSVTLGETPLGPASEPSGTWEIPWGGVFGTSAGPGPCHCPEQHRNCAGNTSRSLPALFSLWHLWPHPPGMGFPALQCPGPSVKAVTEWDEQEAPALALPLEKGTMQSHQPGFYYETSTGWNFYALGYKISPKQHEMPLAASFTFHPCNWSFTPFSSPLINPNPSSPVFHLISSLWGPDLYIKGWENHLGRKLSSK